jgi:hypothetical protein
LLEQQQRFSCSAMPKQWRKSLGVKQMSELTRSKIIEKRKEIEHFLKTDPDIPTRRYLAAKDAELYAALEQIEEGIAA